MRSVTATWLFFVGLVYAFGNQSWPHDYPGKPSGDYSPEWQSYFAVKYPIPNVTFDLQQSWAGNIQTQRQNQPNETLFFWAFEREKGSLTARKGERADEPWAVQIYGRESYQESGIGVLLRSNGPIVFSGDTYDFVPNNFSWSNLADMFWVDPALSIGFSTRYNNASGVKYNDIQHAIPEDFWGFIGNLVKVFPSLAERPLYLIGYQGGASLVTYLVKWYFGLSNRPANLGKIVLADPIFDHFGGLEHSAVLSTIQTFPQLIGYDPAVYKYFETQVKLCGYDINLTYPQQGGLIPYIERIEPNQKSASSWSGRKVRRDIEGSIEGAVAARYKELGYMSHNMQKREELRSKLKRDLSGRPDGELDKWYAGYLLRELVDYAANFTYPWNTSPHGNFGGWDDVSLPENIHLYNVNSAISGPYKAEDSDANFLNNPSVREAIHAPTIKDWDSFGDITVTGFETIDPPSAIMNDLAANASAHGVSFALFHGNGQLYHPHRATEVIIQNTTFGGIQGFTRKPSTRWSWSSGKYDFSGIVHQERNWTYGVVTPTYAITEGGYAFMRDFVFGSNQTGLVTSDNNVVGGQDPALAGDAFPAPDGIVVGTSGSATGTYTAPTASIAAWKSFIGEVVATAAAATASSTGAKPTDENRASRSHASNIVVGVAIVVFTTLLF